MEGDREFPVPFSAFVRGLAGTPDAIYAKLLKIRHGRENHRPSEWRAILERVRREPAR